MKKTRWILGAALMAVAAMVVAQPAQAACLGALMQTDAGDSGETPVVSNPEWPDGALYAYQIAPISPNFSGFFWSLGTGSTTNGVGNDNGTYPASEWVRFFPLAGFPDYLQNAYIRNPAGGPINWTDSRVDGCSQTTACACFILSDEWAGQGYFAVLADAPGAGFNYDFGIPGDYTNGNFRLAPTPKPVIQSSSREAGTNNLLLNITVPALSEGLYQREGCNCVAGFKVFANVVPRGGLPPTGRRVGTDGWVAVNTTAGQPQGVTPIGGTAGVRVDCGATNSDVYLATQIMGDSGFGTQLVSENSTRIECGPTLADPIQRPRVPVNRPMPEGPGRGR